MKQRSHETSKILLGLFLVISVISQGCATMKPKSQFLDKTIELKQCTEDTSKLWWETPGFNWHNYNEVMLDPIALKIDKPNLKTEEIQTAVNSFRQIIAEELSPYKLVDKPGPKVLRISPTITDISTSNPAVNLLTTLALFMPLDMGGATIEVDFFNSTTGERVAAMIDQKTGTPLQLTSAFNRYGHAKHAIEDWAKELKTALVMNP